jgi:hypothetical protein
MKNKKHRMIEILTPRESNVYSQMRFHPPYDSFGVEHRDEDINFYKHAIPSGLVSPKELYMNFSSFLKIYNY